MNISALKYVMSWIVQKLHPIETKQFIYPSVPGGGILNQRNNEKMTCNAKTVK